MRVKQVLEVVPLPSKLKLAWDRLTLSRLTTFYFIFSLLHCAIQTGFQIRAFTINAEAASFLYSISVAGNATDTRVPALGKTDLRLCREVPVNPADLSHCDVVWGGGAKNNSVGASSVQQSDDYSSTTSSTVSVSVATPALTESVATTSTSSTSAPVISSQSVTAPFAETSVTLVITPAVPTAVNVPSVATTPGGVLSVDGDDNDEEADDDFDSADPFFDTKTLVRRSRFKQFLDADGMTQINVTGPGYDNTPVTLSTSCLWSLNWPVTVLENTKREDIVFIAFQFWVLGMSIVALLSESIPHIIASLITHVLVTAWSAFQIAHTKAFRADFGRVIAKGACRGVPLLGDYWEERAKAEYPALALNAVALAISAFLTWKLVKLYGWQTFKRVGASLVMNRIYKLVLSLSIVLQLGFFFMGAAVALWLDNLFNGIAKNVALYITLYKATSFATIFLLVPWLMTGWIAARQEKRLAMFVFLALSLLYLAAWAVMLMADTFRWLFVTWQFFCIVASISMFLTVVTFVLGVICRYNFGRGLPKYLNAQEPLPGDDFTPVYSNDMEKFAFPSNEKPIPTFSASFGKGPDAVPPSEMFNNMGPRFFNPSAQPFEQPHVAPPQHATTRSVSRSDESGTDLSRMQSNGGSIQSYYTYSTSHHHSESVDSHGKPRWVIE